MSGERKQEGSIEKTVGEVLFDEIEPKLRALDGVTWKKDKNKPEVEHASFKNNEAARVLAIIIDSTARSIAVDFQIPRYSWQVRISPSQYIAAEQKPGEAPYNKNDKQAEACIRSRIEGLPRIIAA